MSQLEFNSNTSDELKQYFADIILPLPLPKKYTYEVPLEMVSAIHIGSRVVVQFGKTKVMTGIVAGFHEISPKGYIAKKILDVLDDSPLISLQQLDLFQWISDYYMCSIGEVLNAALPSGLKLNSESKMQLNPSFNEEESEKEFTEEESLLISTLKTQQNLSYEKAGKFLGKKNLHKVVKSLISQERIFIYEEVKEKYIPKVLKKIRLKSVYTEKNKLEELFIHLEKKPKQVEALLRYLQKVPLLDNKEINESGIEKNSFLSTLSAPSVLQTLVKNQIFEEFSLIVSRFDDTGVAINPEIYLTDIQQQAKSEILELIKTKETILLHGITGSGKTEIFIELIKQALEGGSTVLYLLPEIALTTQIVNRLVKIFGNKMGVYHSKFSDNERVEIWKGVMSGRFSFIVGVRSSIFLPFDNLGLIIIDEEHETSYKQHDPAPRYHARDAALVLAKLHNAKTILGSATPSIESYYHATTGKWGLVTLDKRFGEASLPDIILVDTKKEKRNRTMRNDFSHVMLSELSTCLNNKEQAILFQNRRGYAPFLSCELCAHIFKCENCAVSLTYHMYMHELSCHYCGYSMSMPKQCPACESTKLKAMGLGTEKIEDELKLFLPEANVQRMDLDTTRKKNSYKKIIDDFENHRIDVLVGTQMVSKGLDFGNVSTVGIFDADRMLHFPDFRSQERTFQMLTQVSGRAGRRDKKGRVIIQTNNPEQAIFDKIIRNDYEGLYQNELREREKFHYPPFFRLIKITIKHGEEKISKKAAKALSGLLTTNLGKDRVLGPEAPLINKIRNYYLTNIIIKIEREKINIPAVKKIIQKNMEELLSLKDYKNTIILVDVDPV